MYLRTIGRRFTKMIAYFLVMNSKSISSPFCFKELPAENKWIWAKWPVWIRLTEKIASIKRTTQACLFFFFPFLLLFHKLFTALFRGNEIYEAILFQVRPDYSVFTFLREKHSFMVSTNFLFEWLWSNSRSKDAASTYNM